MRPDNLLAVVRASSRACEITEWRRVALHAIPLVSLSIGLFYYWFVVADRRMVFLYDHLGATPFDGVTSSRYWMSALVASGFVLVVHVPALWILGRMGARGLRPYRPPPWWQIWIACAMPVSLALPVIVVAIGKPALSLELAAACLVASWVGLALALAPGHLAAKRPSELVWLAWDGLGLMP